jgi:hypothetical protein
VELFWLFSVGNGNVEFRAKYTRITYVIIKKIKVNLKYVYCNLSLIMSHRHFYLLCNLLIKCKLKGGGRIRPFFRPLSNRFISIRLESWRVPDHIFSLNSLKIHLDHFRAWGTSQVSWKKKFSFQDLETRYFWRVKSADYEYSSMSLQNIFLHKKNQVTLLTPFSLVEPTLKNIFIKN